MQGRGIFSCFLCLSIASTWKIAASCSLSCWRSGIRDPPSSGLAGQSLIRSVSDRREGLLLWTCAGAAGITRISGSRERRLSWTSCTGGRNWRSSILPRVSNWIEWAHWHNAFLPDTPAPPPHSSPISKTPPQASSPSEYHFRYRWAQQHSYGSADYAHTPAPDPRGWRHCLPPWTRRLSGKITTGRTGLAGLESRLSGAGGWKKSVSLCEICRLLQILWIWTCVTSGCCTCPN